MLRQTTLILITLAIGFIGTLTTFGESVTGQVLTVCLLTAALGLTLHQQIVNQQTALETRLQFRFLVESAKPNQYFFHRLKVAVAGAATQRLKFDYMQEYHLRNTWTVAFYAKDHTLKYLFLFTAQDLSELILVSSKDFSSRVEQMLNQAVGSAGWDRRAADRIYRVISWWLADQYKLPLNVVVAMTAAEPRRIEEVTLEHPKFGIVATVLNHDSMEDLQDLSWAEMNARLVAMCGTFLDTDFTAADAPRN